MQLDLDDAETRALLNVLVEVIEADKYPLSPRIRHSDEVRRDRRAAVRARAQAAPCGAAPAGAQAAG